jgi:hypothetical protein
VVRQEAKARQEPQEDGESQQAEEPQMKLIEFPEQTVVIAKDQPEYLPMPAHYNKEAGIVTCLWKLTLRERIKLLFTGKLWHQISTFGMALQPQRLEVFSNTHPKVPQ